MKQIGNNLEPIFPLSKKYAGLCPDIRAKFCQSSTMPKTFPFGLAAWLIFAASSVLADPPVIEAVTAEQRGDGWTISVTLRHADTGWDHYADGWQVLTASGQSLGFRGLLHPHVNEQPFTRSLAGVDIPPASDHLIIRARDNVDGWSCKHFRLDFGN